MMPRRNPSTISQVATPRVANSISQNIPETSPLRDRLRRGRQASMLPSMRSWAVLPSVPPGPNLIFLDFTSSLTRDGYLP